MASNFSASPIFYETLAAVAVCSPADAAEHFDALVINGSERPGDSLERFFDEYVPAATPPGE
jgi:hypothetical protein